MAYQERIRTFGTTINKSEVRQIYNDLDAWLNYCRFNLIKYDPRDLYKSPEYMEWQEKRRRKQQWLARNNNNQNNNNRRGSYNR